MRVFEVNKNSHAHSSVGKGKKLALDFDPRGLIVDVVLNDVIVFSGEMLAQIPGVNVDQVGEASVVLTSSGVDVDATGSALVAVNEDGELTLTVEVGALPAGAYDVVIGGVLQGTLTVTGLEPGGIATVVFSSEPGAGELLLDFNVFGETLEIKQGATLYLSGTLPEVLTESPAPVTVTTELPLLNQGAIATASSHITLTTNGTTLESVEVDLGGVPAGNYAFRVGTQIQGTIVVSVHDGVLSGELIFANGGTSEPLDFDPAGQTVTVEQAGTVLLSRTL
jgi:hypothetical protein